jgi:hypothetical protein
MRSVNAISTEAAVAALKDEIDEEGIGGVAQPLGQLADHLSDRAGSRAGHARADMLRMVSLLSEAAEIAARYSM